jgi:SAM-dependent methyltransferase
MATQWKETYTSDEIEYTNCPLCGDDRQVPLGGQWSLTVVRCQTCSLIYVSPRLKEPEKNYWGEKEKAIAKYGPIFDGKVSHNRDKNYDMILKMIQGLKPSGSFLDIGTHCGFFLRRARDRGWNLYGVEPSPTGSALAREKFGLNVTTGYLDEARFPTRFFDVVTMLDVIEHVTDPLNLLCEVHRILKNDGILLIKTPNGEYNFLKYRIFVKALRMCRLDAFDIREYCPLQSGHYSGVTPKGRFQDGAMSSRLSGSGR